MQNLGCEGAGDLEHLIVKLFSLSCTLCYLNVVGYFDPLFCSILRKTVLYLFIYFNLLQMKTGCVALVLCLNISVDPPDVIKISPCARMECWIGTIISLVYLLKSMVVSF